jgi:site-specific DNA-methyltransferase (adenine-specific)
MPAEQLPDTLEPLKPTRQQSCYRRRAMSLLSAGVRGAVYHADNLEVLARIADASVDLVYIDPPFNTGKVQRKLTLKTQRDEDGDRVGFGGRRYRTEQLATSAYADRFDDYLAFLEPRLMHAQRMLKPSGSLYFHIDYREAHYCKLLLDRVFGRDNFLNEIIWAYDYGGRPKDRWPAKHDTIFFYAKRAGEHVWNAEEIDRIPYMAPGLAGAEKAARGKLPTDTWWHTIVSPTGKEKLGYPTQKPLPILRRIVSASSPPDGLVVDFFAGSGTTGAAALDSGRRFILVDDHSEAISVMRRRFSACAGVVFHAAPA